MPNFMLVRCDLFNHQTYLLHKTLKKKKEKKEKKKEERINLSILWVI